MAIEFPRIGATAPDGAIVGLLGEGASELLRGVRGRLLKESDALDLSPAPAVLLDHALARRDWVQRARAGVQLEALRRAGSTVVLATFEEDLLLRLCDEVWWIRDGALAGRGDPREVCDAYRRHAAEAFRNSASGTTSPLLPRVRRGDGRAEVFSIQLKGEDGRETAAWRSGELAVIRVAVRFKRVVPDPVVGILIRTKIGLNVYGTNTELERLVLGPAAEGQERVVTFGFRCELCPGEYTLTVASHDPNGVWHDWLEDAVAFTVSDTRYTAGVANLRATARLEK